MFSKAEVVAAAEAFVCVHVDPRETRDAREHKGTNYVPEIVVLDSTSRVVTRWQTGERSAASFARFLSDALRKIEAQP